MAGIAVLLKQPTFAMFGCNAALAAPTNLLRILQAVSSILVGAAAMAATQERAHKCRRGSEPGLSEKGI
jgi:hypothetical protein